MIDRWWRLIRVVLWCAPPSPPPSPTPPPHPPSSPPARAVPRVLPACRCQKSWRCVGGYVGGVLSHLVYVGFGEPDQPHPWGWGLYIPQWFMKKTLPLDRRNGLLGTSVWIEGDQASVVISTMRPEVTAQLRYELSEPIYLASCTSIIEHGPMCIEICRFQVSQFHLYPHGWGACLRSTRGVPMSMHAPPSAL